MYRTLKIKLDKSNELIQTAKLWNAACQDVIDYGFSVHDYNKTRLNRATYKDLRDRYPTLPSALLQTARDQASDMLKKLGKWSFAELRSIIEYKAIAIGEKVVASRSMLI